MDASILKYLALIKTVEYGSFTKAAQVLHYSQSGISRMIGDLEKEWRVALLERDRSGVRLTSDGMKLLPHAKSVCAAYEELHTQVEQLHGLQAGMIRIGTFSSVATHWLPKIIGAFQKDYPGMDYEMLMGDYSEIEQWVTEGRVDCGFLRLPTLPELETRELHRDRLLAVLPEHHPMRAYERFPVQAFCDEPFLLLEKGENTEISAIFEQQHLTPRVRFTTWDDYAIMSMVENGLGISILPELILQRIPYRIVVKELDVPAFRTIGIAYKKQRTASLAVKRFLEYLPCRND